MSFRIRPTYRLPLCLLLLAVFAGCGGSSGGDSRLSSGQRETQQEAIAKVEALGGKVTYDENSSGRVTGVYLGSTKVRDDDLAVLEKLPDVTVLNLYQTQITDKGIAHVAKLNKLVELQISYTQVTDEGLKQLSGLSQLAGVHADHSRVTEQGASQLQQSLPNVFVKR